MVAAARGTSDPTVATPPDGDARPPAGRPPRTAPLAIVGRAAGLAGLGLVLTAALAGPAASAANLAPSTVLVVWWVGLPAACAVAGDVMAWLDPFGTLAAAARRVLRRGTPAPARCRSGSSRPPPPDRSRPSRGGRWRTTTAGSPRPSGGSSSATRRSPRPAGPPGGRPGRGPARGSARCRRAGGRQADDARALRTFRPAADRGAAAVVAVWARRAGVRPLQRHPGVGRPGREHERLGAHRAGDRVPRGRHRTRRRGGPGDGPGRGSVRPRRRRSPGTPSPGRSPWPGSPPSPGRSSPTGSPSLLVDGQLALALVSDPLGRGWDLFGTADRASTTARCRRVSSGPPRWSWPPAGGVWGAVAASRTLRRRAVTGCPPAGRCGRCGWRASRRPSSPGRSSPLLASDLE